MKNYTTLCFATHGELTARVAADTKILQSETKELTMNDIDEAVSFIKDGIESKMNHSKTSIQIIITNIIHLNYCRTSDFYNSKA